MAYENLLYEAIFTLFAGFLIFISMILNRIHKFFIALDTYFVLFLFTGIMLSLLGMFLMFTWNFKIRGPYVGARKEERHPFVPFFAAGSIVIMISLTLVYYFKYVRYVEMGLMAMASIGIVLLVIGLFFFARELMKISFRRTQRHSGISI